MLQLWLPWGILFSKGKLEPDHPSVPAGWTACWYCPGEEYIPGWTGLPGAGGLHGTQTVLFLFSLKTLRVPLESQTGRLKSEGRMYVLLEKVDIVFIL